MAGQMSFGKVYNNAGAGNINQSRSYCEGQQANIDGSLVTVNPHEAGSESSVAFIAGFDAITAAGGVITADIAGSCATRNVPINVTVPDVVAATLEAATITLEGLGFVVAGGTALETVATQDPVAGTVVPYGTTVTVTTTP